MNNFYDEVTTQWLDKSQRDLRAALVIFESEEALLDVVVFHCQQAAEKALKAYLVYKKVKFIKTHDLDVLVDLCCQSEPCFQSLDNLADILTPYATEFRYPGDLMEPEREDAEEAIKMAIQIYDFIVERIENIEK